MPIDDPISVVQALNASDERQRSPVVGLAKQFLEIVKLFSPPSAELTLGGVGAAVDWVNRRAEENRRELVDAIAEEVNRQGAEIQRLLETSEEHRHFVAEEMPGLVMEALRLAEQTRAKERIRRLGRILVHASEAGPRDGADRAEEMMRIAVEMSETDITLLREAVKADAIGPGRPIDPQKRFHRANETWTAIPWDQIGFDRDEIEAIASKLQSFGFLASSRSLSEVQNTYVVLQKARDFIEYIRSNAEIG